MNDARLSHTYTSAPYAGKPQNGTGPFYITGTENHVKALVNQLMENASLQGRNISIDRLYTAICTAKWLLSKGITIVGTMNVQSRGNLCSD